MSLAHSIEDLEVWGNVERNERDFHVQLHIGTAVYNIM